MKTKLKILLIIIVAFVAGYLFGNSKHPCKNIFQGQVHATTIGSNIVDCPFEVQTAYCYEDSTGKIMVIKTDSRDTFYAVSPKKNDDGSWALVLIYEM